MMKSDYILELQLLNHNYTIVVGMSENVIMRNPHLFKVTLVFCSTKPPKLWNKNKCTIDWFQIKRSTYSVRRCLNRLTRIRHGLDAGVRDRSQGRALIRGWPVPVSSTKGICHRDQPSVVCRSFLRSSSNLWILKKKNKKNRNGIIYFSKTKLKSCRFYPSPVFLILM